ncbi:MAG: hybrid sensor histidine kinase/response regulator [Nitrospirota bacterium]|nr:hybrid sensor histidine kinase/response regulator [Nitrospirota bacterium]
MQAAATEPSPSSREAAIASERTRILYENLQRVLLGLLAWVGNLCFVYRHAEPAWLIPWATVILLVGVAEWVAIRRYLAAPPVGDAATRWAWGIAASSTLVAVLVGTSPFYLLDPALTTYKYAAYALLVLPVFGSAIVGAPFVALHYGMALGLQLPLVGWLLLNPTPEHWLLISMVMLGSLPVSLVLGRHLGREFLRSLELRYENLELLDHLRGQTLLAEQRGQEKSHFLAATSHDLRQPLHALDLFLGALEQNLSTAEQRNLLKNARRSSSALSDLLNALLDVSQLDSGSILPTPVTTSLAPLLTNIADELRGEANTHGLTLRLRIRDLTVRTDPVLLGRMVRNLATNAVRHTRSGGMLIGVRRRGGFARIQVWDTGPGIANTDREAVFSEFHQLGNPERDRSQGLGLGLAIVRRLSDLLDHPVALLSKPGKGSCFSIDVPLTTERMPVNGETHRVAGLAGAFVVVVDDERPIRQGMRSLLRGWDCELLTASGGDQAVSELSVNGHPCPDVVVADYRLRGGETGLEAVARIRALYKHPIPALILTGDTSRQVAAASAAAGCGILFKPITPEALKQTLGNLL